MKARCSVRTVRRFLGQDIDDLEPRQKNGQAILDELCRSAGIPNIALVVRDGRRETLNGVYTWSREEHRPGKIKIWNRTPVRGKPVSNKVFLETLCHEFCHHYDHFALGLDDSPHTSGFYERCQNLFNGLVGRA